jgi:hypothetical protein
MSRIRSIHPGLFTDEAFMAASCQARILLIGIWTEAWDDGVFEWKPLTLKARIFPVDAVDVPALMLELETLRFVHRFEANGKPYGAVRNFRKYQRPKKPNSSGCLPDDLVSFVGISEPVPNQFPTASEKSPQMEDGGGRVEDEGEEEAATAASSAGAAKIDLKEVERRCVQATGWQATQGFSAIEDLIAEGHDLDERILPMLRTIASELKNRGKPAPDRWAFALKTVRDPSRRPMAEDKPVEMVWITEDSDGWKDLVQFGGKRESLLRVMLRTDGSGKQGLWWAVSQLPKKQRVSA